MKWWWTSILLIRVRFLPTGSGAEVADAVVGDVVDSSSLGTSVVRSLVLFNPDSVVEEDSPTLWTVFGTAVTWSSWAPSIALSSSFRTEDCRRGRKGSWRWSWNRRRRLSSCVDWWLWNIDDVKYSFFSVQRHRVFARYFVLLCSLTSCFSKVKQRQWLIPRLHSQWINHPSQSRCYSLTNQQKVILSPESRPGQGNVVDPCRITPYWCIIAISFLLHRQNIQLCLNNYFVVVVTKSCWFLQVFSDESYRIQFFK
jgi:hypothetical protein